MNREVEVAGYVGRQVSETMKVYKDTRSIEKREGEERKESDEKYVRKEKNREPRDLILM